MINIEPTTYNISAQEEDKGIRLDKFLASALENISRSRLKQLISENQVFVCSSSSSNSYVTINDPSYRVKPEDRFRLDIPDLTEPEPEAQNIPLEIVYEDEHLVVVNKAAGMVVHPAPGNPDGTLVNALLYHCRDSLSGINGVKRPGIVHRIDKNTSGLMLAAKTDFTHKRLARQFAKHSLERAYKAVVWGAPNPASGEIYTKIGRDNRNRLKMAVIPFESSKGKEAVTHYQLLQRLEPPRQPFQKGKAMKRIPPSISIVECRLETGRTHQVRVHMAHMGHPLVGDPVYGKNNPPIKNFSDAAKEDILSFQRQALHAYLIGFKHPVTKEHLTFEADLPNDMKRLISALKKT